MLLLSSMIKTAEMSNTNISQSELFISDAIFLSIGPKFLQLLFNYSRSPLLTACNSHNKSMQRHFNSPAIFRYFFPRNRPVPVYTSTLQWGQKKIRPYVSMSISCRHQCQHYYVLVNAIGHWGSCGDLNSR